MLWAVVHAESKNFNCKMCDKSFSVNGDLAVHMDFVHEKKKNHKCQLCEDIDFASASNLKKHMIQIHSGKNIIQKLEIKMKHQCEYCDKTYLTKGSRDRHLRVEHQSAEIIKNHKCGDCNYAFETNQKLKSHFKIVHLKKEPSDFNE